ncbi:type I-C CRISPR-associated protein Cas5c [Desulfofundulus thermocisternus]|uniref:type I-C CRISPR-associated protein Cas5c n=1 Tax=Desulfofundulus thermocisternus TaxID=42471 RepID=UPI00217D6CF3|nr:type I-C CRISPR-associated protein Cas5c [Desulfofundulus thermocisternus]MCS5695562.1 type I-C CRISPR-associated protein Cas5c [Desulfofundulus thermocisternus]
MERNGMVTVKVWGDYACFTRPEFKVERVSYPVMTPSAARGVLEAIFWKPEFRYEIRAIGVLNMGSEMVILRNEIDRRQGSNPFFVEDARQQRCSLVLKNVAYLIRAEMSLQPWATDPVYKYRDQFNRRVERGQCHHRPYLGTREFAAFFAPADGESPDPGLNLDLGIMLFDIAFVASKKRVDLEFMRHGPQGARRVQGYTQAFFFPARLEQGWLKVPLEKYQELYRLEEGENA